MNTPPPLRSPPPLPSARPRPAKNGLSAISIVGLCIAGLVGLLLLPRFMSFGQPEPIREARKWQETKFHFSPAANAWYGIMRDDPSRPMSFVERAGRSLSGANPDIVYEVPKFMITIRTQDRLPDADKLNGLQWRGQIDMRASAYRTYTAGRGWSQWLSSAGDGIVSGDKWLLFATKFNNIWSFQTIGIPKIDRLVPMTDEEIRALPKP
jgi:hypothetical protein